VQIREGEEAAGRAHPRFPKAWMQEKFSCKAKSLPKARDNSGGIPGPERTIKDAAIHAAESMGRAVLGPRGRGSELRLLETWHRKVDRFTF
jgi:hypothetical protein